MYPTTGWLFAASIALGAAGVGARPRHAAAVLAGALLIVVLTLTASRLGERLERDRAAVVLKPVRSLRLFWIAIVAWEAFQLLGSQA